MKSLIMAFVLGAALLSPAAACASPTVVDLIGERWDDAAGRAVIEDVEGEFKEIRIDARGLEPNAVFSIWLIDVTPMFGEVGIGAGDLIFESDDAGHGVYTARIPANQFKDWDKIEVLHHPNKDTADIEGAELALRGRLG